LAFTANISQAHYCAVNSEYCPSYSCPISFSGLHTSWASRNVGHMLKRTYSVEGLDLEVTVIIGKLEK
jgi:hypothetical protein